MNDTTETLIVGGGQAGLATSYFLTQHGREHLVLEQAAQAGNAWRNDRWDSFALLTPNWSFRLPGAEYQGPAPHAFMPRRDVVAAFEQYVERFALPVQYRVRVTQVQPDNGGYRVSTQGGEFRARSVVIATGLYQSPRIPADASTLDPSITQLHSGQYRNPGLLPPGAVLVVGSGQSGCQIAEELAESGRRVYLSTSSAGRAPRHYRGRDVYEWLHLCGFLDRTPDQLPSPKARFGANPHLSGRGGGHTINLHQFARDGITLLGHLRGVEDQRAGFAPDLHDNLAKADQFEAALVALIDGFIERTGLDAPLEALPALRDGYAGEPLTALDLSAAGITSIIWAMGYRFDFGLVKLPILDADGYPVQQRGVTQFPGLYFVGLSWLSKMKSGLLLGVGEDAEYIASVIAARAD